MLSIHDVFEGDQVRSEYVSAVKQYAEMYCHHFQWVIIERNGTTREGIRYQIADHFIDWYIPTDKLGIEAFVEDNKLKRVLLSHLRTVS